jgi:hypothetical protein
MIQPPTISVKNLFFPPGVGLDLHPGPETVLATFSAVEKLRRGNSRIRLLPPRSSARGIKC